MGAVIVSLDDSVRSRLYEFGIDLGILFQVQDDILDATQSAEEAGKPTRNDGVKNSFVTLLGLEKSMEYADGLSLKLEKAFGGFDAPIRKALMPLMREYLSRHRG
jgi:farnesyl diphosphate synthase